MPIALVLKTVFSCKCVLCGHPWDADRKPGRCGHCKNRGWNGEDHRRRKPYGEVPVPSQIKTGQPAPPAPNAAALLHALVSAKAIIAESRGDHQTLINKIDAHIAKLRGLKPKRSTYLVTPARKAKKKSARRRSKPELRDARDA